ncbi:hypothetical protein LX36DRAFT_580157 [Colletotrichum falcatum]|nr:hypothetical protein LX36DRAFT_580157 [Colletotrichum falcatum]
MFVILFLSCLAALVSAGPLDSVNLETRNSPMAFDKVFWVDEGHYKCTSERKKQIITAIDEARFLTNRAIGALWVENAEKSEAYLTWFGKRNASPEMRRSILKHNYQSLITNLVHPEGSVKLDNLDDIVEKIPFPATGKSLVYACSPEDSKVGKMDTEAQTLSPIPQSTYSGPTYLVFYPAFFRRLRRSWQLQETAEEWKHDKNAQDVGSGGFVLLHEFQHLLLATGTDRHCGDVSDPSFPPGTAGCYTASCCRSIPDSLKVKNAQNFAFFAAYVYKWPKTAKASWGH